MGPARVGPCSNRVSDGHAPFTGRPKAQGNTESASQPAMRTRIASSLRQDESQVTFAEDWMEMLVSWWSD